jgi:Flp pilus assembly protein CpaB
MNDYPNQPGFPPFGGANIGASMPPTVTQGKKKGRRGPRKDSGGPSRKSSSSMGLLFLLFAAAVGVLGIVVTQSPEDSAYVVRARAGVSALTAVDSEQFEIVAVDPASVEPEAFSGEDIDEVKATFTEAIDGKWFLYPVGAGQQIRPSMLFAVGELDTPLGSNERLVAITVRAANAVSGTIRAGSTVDVYVSDPEGLTGVLGQGVEIVAVSLLPEQFESVAKQQFDDPNKTLSDFVAQQPVGGTYVVRINAQDVAKYIAANAAGTITLSLHGDDSTSFTAAPTDIYQTICGVSSTEPACERSGEE